MKNILLHLFFLLFLFSCARAPLKDPNLAFRLSKETPALQDVFPIETFQQALASTIKSYEAATNIPQEFSFEGRKVSRADYLLSLKTLEKISTMEELQSFLKENFDFYEVYGSDDWGKVFSTGYYDPLIIGSPKKTQKYSQALYKTPDDLVTIDLAAYAQRNPDIEDLKKIVESKKNASWRGRLLENKKIIPYYERKEIDPIDTKSPYSGKNMEIAWVDPIDAFFLQIQGSGVVEFSKGQRIRVGYASQNGSPYFALGKALVDVIPLEQMSMQRIRQYLETLPNNQKQELFNNNPSYVFFQELNGKSLTYSGAEVTPGRTIATDSFLFPKGLLGYLEIENPEFADSVSMEPTSWGMKPRLIFDQDTGGAIKGGGRVDLYYGEGPEAERLAGVMRRTGKLWYLVPKASFLAKWSEDGDPQIHIVPKEAL